MEEAAMHKLFMLGLIAMIVLLGVQRGISPALAAEDDGSKITITAPKDGDTVGDTFELKYELVKGSKAAHAHVYLDGKYQKGFDGPLDGLGVAPPEVGPPDAPAKERIAGQQQLGGFKVEAHGAGGVPRRVQRDACDLAE